MAAPPLLLINGYAATAADWDPTFIAALERSFELICPDNPGVGAAPLGALVGAMDAWHASEQPAVNGTPPVLIAHGSEDIVIPPENSDRLTARWPNSRVEHFAGDGHAFMAQEPERLADLITSFLRR